MGIDGVGFFRLWLPLSSRRRPASHRIAQGALKTNTAKKKPTPVLPSKISYYTFFPGIGKQATTYFLPHSSSFFLRKSVESLCVALSDPSFLRKVGLLPLLGKVSVATQIADKRELEKERKGCVCPIASLHCYTYLTYYTVQCEKSPWTEKDKKRSKISLLDTFTSSSYPIESLPRPTAQTNACFQESSSSHLHVRSEGGQNLEGSRSAVSLL